MRYRLLGSGLALALMASPGWAQTAEPSAMPDSSSLQQAVIVLQKDDQVRADNYIGAPVMAGAGEGAQEIGSVEDLIFDGDHRIKAAIVGVGGFLGIGAKSVAIDWAALERGREDGEIVFITSLSREDLENAPAFKTIEAQLAERAREEALKQEQQDMQQSPTGQGDPMPVEPQSDSQ